MEYPEQGLCGGEWSGALYSVHYTQVLHHQPRDEPGFGGLDILALTGSETAKVLRPAHLEWASTTPCPAVPLDTYPGWRLRGPLTRPVPVATPP